MTISPKPQTAQPDLKPRPLNWRANFKNMKALVGTIAQAGNALQVNYDAILTGVPGYAYNSSANVGDSFEFDNVSLEIGKKYSIYIVYGDHVYTAKCTIYHGSEIIAPSFTYRISPTRYDVVKEWLFTATVNRGTIRIVIDALDAPGENAMFLSRFEIREVEP